MVREFVSSDGYLRRKIFTATKNDEVWTNFIGFPFNSNDYSITHPTVSSDGNKIYFSSNMPGGFGGFDLYYSEYSVEKYKGWSPPINLGPRINTEGHEITPFYHETTNQLYFASDGYKGLGGYDIFVFQLNSRLKTPQNLGNSINSRYDDKGFIISKGEKFGYWSSNKPSGKGGYDIYTFRK